MTNDRSGPATGDGSGDETDGDPKAADRDRDGARDDHSADDGRSPIDFHRTVISVCLVGTILGSLLPWVAVSDVTIYGFEVYGAATIALAILGGGLAFVFEWDRRAMIVLFVAGVLVAAIALLYVPLAGIGAIVTAVSGGILAFTAIGGYGKQG